MPGSVLAVVLFTILSSELTPEAFKQWGWRIPFLFGAVLTVAGLNVTGFVAQAFGMSYLSTQIGLTSTQTLVTTLTMMGVGLFALLFGGWLCDRIGAIRVLYLGASTTRVPLLINGRADYTGNFSIVTATRSRRAVPSRAVRRVVSWLREYPNLRSGQWMMGSRPTTLGSRTP
ncbi:hypothetical protein QRX50_23490 [Amycolatopsis carbonis]|uniref:Uncharacterized protein n=1 Tax=Amycolatopsis carbonis TaxID=715471 RepID=A0A9Y2INB8_9PSEU|nr:hypothetical protein [Amycolatopsis sp. 2-15]WIX83510.1 hypothetical protein QRX50_23490 [Amycolatopsis sp. 2-15]